MRLPPTLIPATFQVRLNRFAALVSVEGQQERAHVANSGRLRELFVPGRTVFLAPQQGDRRTTRYDIALVDLGHTLVSADARLPPVLVHEAFQKRKLPQFQEFTTARREVPFGHSRLDLALFNGGTRCLIEVKSVTLVRQGVGLFPDAPTERGRRHLKSLVQAREEGHRAAVIFVIQREDAIAFASNDEADPAFGEALREASREGVKIFSYRCRVTHKSVKLAQQVPLRPFEAFYNG